MTPITVCLLHWRRPEQLRSVLDALSGQQPKPVIFLWNNSGAAFSHPAVAWQVDSSINVECLPRVWMAGWAATPWICLHDDDLMPRDAAVLRDLVEAAEALGEDQAVGPAGAILPPDRPYLPHRGTWCPVEATPVDLVKGRCLVARTEVVRQRLRLADVARDHATADDIIVCGALAAGRRLHHVVPAGLRGRFRNLPVGQEACSAQPSHAQRRQRAFEKWQRPS